MGFDEKKLIKLTNQPNLIVGMLVGDVFFSVFVIFCLMKLMKMCII